MRKARLSGIILLGFLLAALTFRYAFYQPFIPDGVFEAVPSQASYVHKASSLAELLQSPVCGELDKALGAGNSLESLLDSSSWTGWACSSEIVITDLPVRYAGQGKSWAAVCWTGWRSPWLRWRLEHTRASGLSRLGKHAVWPVWQYERPDIARGSILTLALTDNLFIVCLSENPDGILLLLDTYDNRMPSVADSK
jgi:hypothetical protein